jgi:hypothetical protein
MLLRGLPDCTGRDDAGLETWITRAHDAVDVKVILETGKLIIPDEFTTCCVNPLPKLFKPTFILR